MQKHYFTKGIEKMIDPIEVGTIHFMQNYTKAIPVGLQNKIIAGSAKDNKQMGFVVEPYSFFLSYEIKDLELARKLIPDNYALVKTKILNDDGEPKYYCIFGCFNVHSSAFWGTRMEFYIIAENKDTGLLSWVIVDYSTNTVSFDEKNGLGAGNTVECILTTNYDSEVIVDIKDNKENRQLVVEANISNGKESTLFSRLWLEGNLSIAYGRVLSKNKSRAFALVFNPKEVQKALYIPCEDVFVETNTWFPGLFESVPASVVCFPFAQHYLSDSPGHFSLIKNEKELVEIVNAIDFDTMPHYSSKALKKAFGVGQTVSFLAIILLLILLFLK